MIKYFLLVLFSLLIFTQSLFTQELKDLVSELNLTEQQINEIVSTYPNTLIVISDYIGTPYLYGGTTKNGIDCSAFVQKIFFESFNIELPRVSKEQAKLGETIEKDNLGFVDLVFFDIRRKGRISHVGIYLLNGYFVHSGTKKGVSIESIDSKYYSSKYFFAKRII